MQMQSHVNFSSPQIISGASQQNSGAAFFQTEVAGDLFKNEREKKKTEEKHKMAPNTLSAVIQHYLLPYFKMISSLSLSWKCHASPLKAQPHPGSK